MIALLPLGSGSVQFNATDFVPDVPTTSVGAAGKVENARTGRTPKLLARSAATGWLLAAAKFSASGWPPSANVELQ
ncbi:unannotated protein [freshwater metagenome]|uniref:Unannotated protein n=1 Tax=freshwater metagenome TaxID=449393 RepID=A0A6J7UPK6_9ZZZZ